VARAADLEKNLVLTFKQNLPVVDAAGEIHESECADQFVAPEPGGECAAVYGAKIRFRRGAGKHVRYKFIASRSRARAGVELIE
jgi:hypothetical protein